MKYAFLQEHEREFSLKRMCRVLEVSRSGYYAWKGRCVSRRAQENEGLLSQILSIHQESGGTYGSPRIFTYLRQHGWGCSRKRVARLMRQHRIVGKKTPRRAPITTQARPGDRLAPNWLNREFSAAGPDQKWAGDITYIDTHEGWLYLAVLVDLYSRRVVGWAMGERIDEELTLSALRMAQQERQPEAGLLHHTDRGRQYTSQAYQDQLAEIPCQVSLSRSGDCYDNAVVESFFATLKTECADHPFKTKQEARTTIFEYIEGWYNRQRLHSSLDYLSPVEFELQSGH
jgi:transposase InsO family protein